jgi:ribonuclease HI
MPKNTLIIHTDGGSRGNPGPAACAFVAEMGGKVLKGQSKFLGISTNNKAEYEGVLFALEWLLGNKEKLLEEKKTEIYFCLDSELVVKQLNGIYRIKKRELQLLSIRIKKFANQSGKKIFFKHIPRAQNKTADLLVNKELDKHF